jgi:DNA-binding transcriptional MerR regulator
MNENIFEYLKILGFTCEEINYIEENNDNIVYANLAHVKQIILFLQKLKLSFQDIRKICIINVFMLTETFRRINRLNSIYVDILGLNISQIQKLIVENPYIYTINPIELERIINYLKDKNYNIEIIKRIIIQNSKVIGMKFEEFVNTKYNMLDSHIDN